ncbi:MAG TPA: EAL domain-containing protein [Burkholderiales bacterium]|nr:EAL domain-containing protein [Burkholderiales bacterium]
MQPVPEFKPVEHTVSVLLLEDDPDFAALVRRCVAGLSGQPKLVAAQTLAEAVLALRAEAFDLVLADLWLPDSAGLDTLQRIAAATTCPIIVLTASDDPGMREAALAAGAYEFVQKSEFDSQVLARLVRLGAIQARTFRSLRQSEARFRSLTQLSSDWYWEQDSEFRLTFMSSHMGERTGLAASDYLGRKRWEQPAPNLTEADWARHRAQLERREPFRDFEMQRRVEGRGSVWLSISGEPVYDADGRFVGYRGVGRDITAQKRAQAALQRFRTALDRSADMFFLVDMQENRLLDFNETACAVLGYAREELLGIRSDKVLAGKTIEQIRASHAELVQKRTLTGETAYRRKDGSIFPVEVRRTVLETAEGRILVINSRDLTERKAEEARKSAHLRYQQRIATFGQSALACRDARELAEEAVQQALLALGADTVGYVERGAEPNQLVARALAGYGAEARRDAVSTEDPVSHVMRTGEYYSAERCALPFEWAQPGGAVVVPVPGDPEVRGALCAVARAGFAAEELNFLDAVAAVLSAGLKRLASEERLAYLAQFDSLTGLPNRGLLADRFAQMIEQARRRGLILSALFVDLDDFKSVNDTLGHAAGDELLKEAARRLSDAVRQGDTVARISGDEFALVLADLSRQEDAALVAQKIVECLAAPFQIGGHEVLVTASVGIASYPADGHDAESLLGAADAAMYRAKQSGRNTYQFFTSEINQRTRARALLGADLRRALEREEFSLAYQPKFDLATMRPCGGEALLRWNHPERGQVSPAQFVHVLEESGLIVRVGEWLLARACEDLLAINAASARPVPIAVNLSARQFRQHDLAARIRALIAEAGVPPELIELEITESHLMHDPAHAIHAMRTLRDEGVRIAIDDFGTGYSSLAYLTRFPVAALKIDRSFVAGIGREASDAAIVRTIIEMARSLGSTVIAEGVETQAQVGFLRRFGCHQAQGYFFAPPMAIGEFIQLICSDNVAPPRKVGAR